MIFELERWDGGRMLVNPDFAEILEFNGIHRAEDLWTMDGESVKKQLVERGTERVVLRKPCGNGELVAYIKRYTPIPLKKRLKDLFSLKCVSRNEAYHEWEAILEFHAHGLPTMLPVAVAKAKAGSCNLTLGITDYTRASDLARQLAEQGAAVRDRRRDLIQKVAKLARGVHDAGMAHQDFYLVHIFIKEGEHDRLFLIDLQRVIIRDRLPRRWRIKDLAQLLYSSADYVSKSDIMYFWKYYADPKMFKDRRFTAAVIAKAERIKHHSGRNRN